MRKRHLLRQELMEMLYQHLLLGRDMDRLAEDYQLDRHDDEALFVLKLLEFIHLNKEVLVEKINPLLNEWTFERIPVVDQSILMMACAELDRALEDRAVIIDEAIELAKTYSDDDAYKYINAVLDAYA